MLSNIYEAAPLQHASICNHRNGVVAALIRMVCGLKNSKDKFLRRGVASPQACLKQFTPYLHEHYHELSVKHSVMLQIIHNCYSYTNIHHCVIHATKGIGTTKHPKVQPGSTGFKPGFSRLCAQRHSSKTLTCLGQLLLHTIGKGAILYNYFQQDS